MEVTDVCHDCGNPIIFTGSFWDHVGAIKPKHPASPVTSKPRGHFAQLQVWREKGLAPQLHSAPEGWVLILDTTKWGRTEMHERGREQLIHFCTAPCESPEAAIEAALQMVQP